jgi:lipoic acid synthetase
MDVQMTNVRTSKIAGEKEINNAKTSRIPIKIIPQPMLRKPEWIRMKVPDSGRYQEIKKILRDNQLHTVCEEASCPNIGECFSGGTATFMILGDICTRRCPFCDVAHGKPLPPDVNEPENLARTIAQMKLNYVVITSVDRDDLKDGGAQHFVDCIHAVRTQSPNIKIEILVPDFRGRLDVAIEILRNAPPDVMNHNLETIPRLYKQARPGSDYHNSLQLLKKFGEMYPDIPTKSGLMLGLGETDDEILEVMRDLRAHKVSMLTLGQYLQPSVHHLPVMRYVDPASFDKLKEKAEAMGFNNTASGPMVRSSYHADVQSQEVIQLQMKNASIIE